MSVRKKGVPYFKGAKTINLKSFHHKEKNVTMYSDERELNLPQ